MFSHTIRKKKISIRLPNDEKQRLLDQWLPVVSSHAKNNTVKHLTQSLPVPSGDKARSPRHNFLSQHLFNPEKSEERT